MITEQQAIEASQHFVAQRKHTPLDVNSIKVTFSENQGRPTFMVSAYDAIPHGEEEWMQPSRVPLAFLVDANDGTVYGYETERGRTVFG
ncbi:hypothetical protein [Allorhizobium taibaishanense]|uniref:PepSY domain-containing protein n=1 Tax=Allorhizobium taibaishanense TaxID=887144 RepID=A0A1Q9A433_9HYPH|nr:hypothetical protein [Allorhizobium taibaishanense]MBB4006407.1 hypothetical protein [Allorhizobium taibaishanense]OLP49355.1 hypothetical protein BJF91_20115 [Allorhizobium taibaishanense]